MMWNPDSQSREWWFEAEKNEVCSCLFISRSLASKIYQTHTKLAVQIICIQLLLFLSRSVSFLLIGIAKIRV
ncbi:hypothetical protein Hdeb2414_s0016g00474471 [Helianthus debilis subsp. tardiflorus]